MNTNNVNLPTTFSACIEAAVVKIYITDTVHMYTYIYDIYEINSHSQIIQFHISFSKFIMDVLSNIINTNLFLIDKRLRLLKTQISLQYELH